MYLLCEVLTPYYHMKKDIYFNFIHITFTGNYSKLMGVVARGLAFLLCGGFLF